MARAASASCIQDTLGCSHYHRGCAGCTREEGLFQPSQYVEARKVFASYGNQDLELATVCIEGWRCRAKLAVRGSREMPEIGLFRRGTHEVVDIVEGGSCIIHHPRINEAAIEIKSTMKKLLVAPYNEVTRQGLVRYIQLTAVGGAGSGDGGFRAELDPQASIQVVLVLNCKVQSKESKAARGLARELWKRGGEGLVHSVWLNFHEEEGPKKRLSDNTILGGGGFELLHGEEQMWQKFLHSSISIGPGSFVQANYGAFALALKDIRQFALEKKDARVLELHAGVGSIGLSLFSSSGEGPRWLRCVEINPAGKEHFLRSRDKLMSRIRTDGGPMPDLDYLVAPASDERCLGWLGGSGEIEGVDVVIVDPPKKGLEPGVLSALTAHYDTVKGGEPSKDQLTLIYLSCGWDALKKEMAALMEARWRLVHSRAFLFFPGTDAIETLAIFKR